MLQYSNTTTQLSVDKSRTNAGFTLIELMVALVVGAVVMAITYSVYTVQQRSFKRETMVVRAQQNVRTAFILIEKELRMVGYDRSNTDLFGITNIRLDAAGNGTLTFTADMGDANADNGFLDGNETFTYALYDSATTPAVGNLDLGRTVGTVGIDPTELVAAGIEALGFVYAFDADADGRLDFNDIDGDGIMDPPNEGIYWAVDSDGDNDLDIELDTNKDGEVNTADGTAALPADVAVDRIRAMKVFILARTKGEDMSYSNNEVYRVGSRVVAGGGDRFRRRLLVTTIRCRNLGL
jgi:type IV pilus assembly protein PilW